jgi:2-oxoglutarate ferredoxin oxidoreductase subunit beta
MTTTVLERDGLLGAELERKPTAAKDYKGKVTPDWCPGCGDFGVLNAFTRAVHELQIMPHQLLVVSGIGCSSNFPGYVNAYGMHTLHGRSLAVATGAKMANHELTVVCTGGDGDGYGIGGNHLMHTSRRNVDLTYLVMNNQIYGLTTGQISPTSRPDMKTKSTPFGNLEQPINPITSAMMNGATYVARGFSADIKQLTELIKGGIRHQGFALIDIFSPCVTFNLDNDYPFFKDRVRKLEDEGHDTGDWKSACEKAMEWGDTIWTGLFLETDRPSLDGLEPVLDGPPIARRPLGITEEQGKNLIARMM